MSEASPIPAAGHLLFTYGSLMLTTGIPAVDDAMRAAGASLGRAYVLGNLFDLGDYPGAIPVATKGAAACEEDAPKVWGHLLRLKDPAALFAVIDSYEGFDAGNLKASAFVRAETEVFLNGHEGGVPGQIYWYNFPTLGHETIASGDYLAHWSGKGRPGQGRRVAP